jgi:hypothetical protein
VDHLPVRGRDDGHRAVAAYWPEELHDDPDPSKDRRFRVRPRERTSKGNVGSWRSVCEAGHELVGQLGIVDLIDTADHFFGVPGCLHLSFRVSCGEEPQQLGSATVVESFVGFGQQSSKSDTTGPSCGLDGPESGSGPGAGIRPASSFANLTTWNGSAI